MLAKCPTTKPLFKYERDLDFQKHKLKLKEIISKSPNSRAGKSVQIRPWVQQKLKNQTYKHNKMIEEQNQKLLSKLMKISTRKDLKNHDGIKHRMNPYRKNWLNSIKRENQQFGEKLIHLRSSLQYSRFSKSIGEYQKVKKTMQKNRRAILPQLGLKQTGSNYLKNFFKTEPSENNDFTKQNEETTEKKSTIKQLDDVEISTETIKKE